MSYKVEKRTVFDGDLFTDILTRIANGEHLHVILKDEEMPALSTFHRWLAMDKEAADAYSAAQEAKMHLLAEQTIVIADESHPKLVKKAELQVKSRQWLAERLGRKVFAEQKNQPQINGNVTINNNTIHALLTKGTEMNHVIDVTAKPNESHDNATGNPKQTNPDHSGGK